MNNQQRKYIPVSDTLPTKNYWIAFIIIAIILCFVNYNNARTDIAIYNDNIFLEDISEDEENKILTAVVIDSVIASVIACAWGIILNIALRYKIWRWRWVLLYAVTVTALVIVISSLVNGKLTAGSVGWVWWALIGLYRREYVNTHLKYVQKSKAPSSAFATASASSSNNTFSPVFCTKCGKTMNNKDKFCYNCGTVVNEYIDKPRSTEAIIEDSKIKSHNSDIFITDIPIKKTNTPVSPLTTEWSAYYQVSKKLAQEIAPKTKLEDMYDYIASSNRRLRFECTALLSFLHYLATRDDEYAEIDVETYENAFNINNSEKEFFLQRLSDYIEIAISGAGLPHVEEFVESLDSKTLHDKAESCYHLDYLYAFTMFCRLDKLYDRYINIDEAKKLNKENYHYIFREDAAKIFSLILETYDQLCKQ